MLEGLFEQYIHEISWNTGLSALPNAAGEAVSVDSIYALECYKYENLENPQEGRNCRWDVIADQPRDKNIELGDVETRLQDWLEQKGTYRPLLPGAGTGKCLGGLRLVICDHPYHMHGMTMSKAAYLAISKAFSLDSATLPAFVFAKGTQRIRVSRGATNQLQSISMVMNYEPREDVGNAMLSLTYNVESRMTYALLCGYGVSMAKKFDSIYGMQRLQLNAVLMSSGQYWNNPLVLPAALSQVVVVRSHMTTRALQRGITLAENSLGFSMRAQEGTDDLMSVPVQNAQDPNIITKKLHFFLPQASAVEFYVLSLRKQFDFMFDTERLVAAELQTDLAITSEIRETLNFLASVNDSMIEEVKVWRDRATTQVNLLFHLVGQQDNNLNRASNKLSIAIARSTKQDSISVSTFTFITALFLPGTFVATVFSMSIFNWQSESGALQSANSNDVVSNRFWIYWAIVVPLTFVTLSSWYMWFRYASHKYYESLVALEEEQDSTDNAGKLRPVPKPSESDNHLPVRRRDTWRKEVKGIIGKPTKQPAAQQEMTNSASVA